MAGPTTQPQSTHRRALTIIENDYFIGFEIKKKTYTFNKITKILNLKIINKT